MSMMMFKVILHKVKHLIIRVFKERIALKAIFFCLQKLGLCIKNAQKHDKSHEKRQKQPKTVKKCTFLHILNHFVHFYAQV